jgi:hypothetical protein
VWDSATFPSQGSPGTSRITVMAGTLFWARLLHVSSVVRLCRRASLAQVVLAIHRSWKSPRSS